VDKKQKELARSFFSRHAQGYVQSISHAGGRDLKRLLELLEPRSSERALDVATGPGHTALALAPFVREVIGIDLTPEMAMPFAQAARERGLRNVRFLVGDAESLPFPEGEFHLVTTRRAAHHFPRIARALAEMARVLKPGGRLGIADMVAPENPEAAQLFNALEAARDNSHVRAYTVEEWQGLIKEVGLSLLHLEAFEEEVAWPEWLYPLDPKGWEAKRVEEVLAQASPGTRPLVVREGPGDRTLIKRRMVLVALKG